MQTAIDPETNTHTDNDVERLLDDVEGFLLGETTLAAMYGLDEQDVQAFADLADQLLEAGRIEDALTMYEGCVALNPLDVSVLCGYGLTLRLGGQREHAAEVFAVARMLAPKDPDLEDFLAVIH